MAESEYYSEFHDQIYSPHLWSLSPVFSDYDVFLEGYAHLNTQGKIQIIFLEICLYFMYDRHSH